MNDFAVADGVADGVAGLIMGGQDVSFEVRYSQPFCWPKGIINLARGNAPGTSDDTNLFGQRP